MTPAAALAALAQWTQAEIAALEAGDFDALMIATRTRAQLMVPLRAADPRTLADLPRELVIRAAALNQEVARRINAARACVERRLWALARAAGRDPLLAYGPDGRMTMYVLRPRRP